MTTKLEDVINYQLICDATADHVAVIDALAWLTTHLAQSPINGSEQSSLTGENPFTVEYAFTLAPDVITDLPEFLGIYDHHALRFPRVCFHQCRSYPSFEART
jgi:hypothetical protein